MVGLFDGWMVDAFYERMLSLKRDLLAAHRQLEARGYCI